MYIGWALVGIGIVFILLSIYKFIEMKRKKNLNQADDFNSTETLNELSQSNKFE